ncbi:MAG: hypothetical protein LBU60_05170 [Clostridiales bacterium]|jgi:hypothetical protein|nr:hypothetical protein [Clostridiales bacterium]
MKNIVALIMCIALIILGIWGGVQVYDWWETRTAASTLTTAEHPTLNIVPDEVQPMYPAPVPDDTPSFLLPSVDLPIQEPDTTVPTVPLPEPEPEPMPTTPVVQYYSHRLVLTNLKSGDFVVLTSIIEQSSAIWSNMTELVIACGKESASPVSLKGFGWNGECWEYHTDIAEDKENTAITEQQKVTTMDRAKDENGSSTAVNFRATGLSYMAVFDLSSNFSYSIVAVNYEV